MTTADALREQLGRLGLDTTGLKQTLKARLRAFKKKHPELFSKSSNAAIGSAPVAECNMAEVSPEREVEGIIAPIDQLELEERPLHPNSRFDYYLCFDVEATCERNHSFTFPNEVIEFPIVLLDGRTLEVVDEFHSYVKPTFRPILSEFCVELTGIQQEVIDEAPTFLEVLEQFEQWMVKHNIFINVDGQESLLPSLLDPKKKYNPNSPAVRNITSVTGCKVNPQYSYCFVTDGPFDIRDFIGKQCLHSRISRPFYFTKAFLDIRTAFRNFFELERWLNLEGMLTFLGESFEGRQHSGICDARMVGLITRRLGQGFKAEDLQHMGMSNSRSNASASISWNVDKLAVGCVLKPNQKRKLGNKEYVKMTPFKDLPPVERRAASVEPEETLRVEATSSSLSVVADEEDHSVKIENVE
ncbi:3'-5' exoribonuclease 1 [Actinomortierella wolfii]|nr:3'-5' exoribonuclease 1 [Actinomortierella wolfii]